MHQQPVTSLPVAIKYAIMREPTLQKFKNPPCMEDWSHIGWIRAQLRMKVCLQKYHARWSFSQAAFVPGEQSKSHLKAASRDQVTQKAEENSMPPPPYSPQTEQTRYRQYVEISVTIRVSSDNVPLSSRFWKKFYRILKVAFRCINTIENKLFSGKEFPFYDRHLWKDITWLIANFSRS